MIELLKNNYQNDYSIEIENEKTFFIWFVKPGLELTNKDVCLEKSEIIKLAHKEISEWWEVFENDEESNETSEDVLGMEIKNYLLEDDFPKEIITEAINTFK